MAKASLRSEPVGINHERPTTSAITVPRKPCEESGEGSIATGKRREQDGRITQNENGDLKVAATTEKEPV